MGLLAALALVALSACSSVTSGQGQTPTVGASSGPDFPGGSSGAGGATAVSTPRHTAPSTPVPTGPTAPPTVPTQPGGSAGIPAPSSPVKTVTVHGSNGDFEVSVWVLRKGKDCAAHAYGAPVIKYLGAHPCAGMTRLLATTKVGGRDVGFAEERVTFGGAYPKMYTYAGKFRALVTKDGTGNINDLMREGYRLPSGPSSVPYPNAFAAQNQDAVVSVFEGWYLSGSTPDNDPALVHMLQECFLQV